MVPWPTMTSVWSKGGRNVRPRSATSACTAARPSAWVVPRWMTCAVQERAVDLHLGGRLRHDHGDGHLLPGAGQGEGLGKVAAGAGHHAAGAGLRRQTLDGVGGAALLEAARAVEVLALEKQPELEGVGGSRAKQRTSGVRGTSGRMSSAARCTSARVGRGMRQLRGAGGCAPAKGGILPRGRRGQGSSGCGCSPCMCQ